MNADLLSERTLTRRGWRSRRTWLAGAAVTLALAGAAARLPADAGAGAVPPAGGYTIDLAKLPVGKVPDELFVLSGSFAIVDAGGKHVLEAPGEPTDAIGMLFGPKGGNLNDVSARIKATSAGKTFPEIGIGNGDAGGYKLMLMPGQQTLELRRNDEPRARADYKAWKSGEWTSLRMRVTKAGPDRWKVEGKAWPSTEKEPEAWAVSFEDTKAPAQGQASVWANPYPGTPVDFDDLHAATTP